MKTGAPKKTPQTTPALVNDMTRLYPQLLCAEIVYALRKELPELKLIGKFHAVCGKLNAVVKYMLGPDQSKKIFASRYNLHLPSEAELVTLLKRKAQYLR